MNKMNIYTAAPFKDVSFATSTKDVVWWHYILKAIASYSVFVGILSLINPIDNKYLSLLIVVIAATFSIATFYFLLLRTFGFKSLIIVLGAFLFKFLLGYGHFLTFIQPDYFNSNIEYDFLRDYVWMDESMAYIADIRREGGYFSAIPDWFWIENKNSFLFYWASDLYVFGGNFVLNICPFNTMMSMYTALTITWIAKNYFMLSNSSVLSVLILTSFFPMSFLPDMTFRDLIGQFLLTIGLVLMINLQINKKLLYLLPLACFLFFMQRKIYVIVPVIAFVAANVPMFQINALNTKNKTTSNITAFLMIIGLVLFSNQLNSLSEAANFDAQGMVDAYGGGISKAKFYLLFPIYLFKGFMGPFPWVQFFKFEQGTVFQPMDYAMSVYMITIVILFGKKFLNRFRDGLGYDIVSLSGVLLFLLGVTTIVMHTGYLAIGFMFLLPLFVHYFSLRKFATVSVFVLFYFIILNLFWVGLGFYGDDLWGNFRFK